MKHLIGFVAIFFAFMTFTPLAFAQQANLGDVTVRFCNDPSDESGTSSLQMNAEAGEPEEICIYLSNSADQPVTVGLNFVDGTITADVDQKKACQPEGVKEQFGQYVDIEQDTYEIDANATIQTTATVTFPAGYAGMNYGCLTSQIVSDDGEGSDGMFRVQTRKANFIDVLVEGNIELGLAVEPQQLSPSIDNLSDNEQIAVYHDIVTDQLIAKVGFRNTGNIPQDVTIKGTISDLVEHHELPSTTKKILPKQTATFTFPLDVYIPLYEGLMDIKLDVTYQPDFEFESTNIDESMRQPETFTMRASFVLIPWNLILIVLAILILLWLMSRKKGNSGKRSSVPTKHRPTPPAATVRKKSSKKDKLTKIKGVGPKIQTLLYNAGITTYEDLSNTKVAELRRVLKKAGPRYKGRDVNDWKKQATLAKNGKWDELKKMNS